MGQTLCIVFFSSLYSNRDCLSTSTAEGTLKIERLAVKFYESLSEFNHKTDLYNRKECVHKIYSNGHQVALTIPSSPITCRCWIQDSTRCLDAGRVLLKGISRPLKNLLLQDKPCKAILGSAKPSLESKLAV